MDLNDLYESLASQFLALLWIVQKNKELKWSENILPKTKEKKNKKKKQKKKNMAVKKKTPKGAQKTISKKKKKNFLLP